jgi:hypothetical protein
LYLEVEILTELGHRDAQRDEVTAYIADPVADLGRAAAPSTAAKAARSRRAS